MFARTVNLGLKPNRVTEPNPDWRQGDCFSAAKAERIPGRSDVPHSGWNGSGRYQFVGSERECGSPWPRSLSAPLVKECSQ